MKVEADDQQLELIPYGFLELLALPDGSINEGDQTKATTGAYTVVVTAKSMAEGTAELNYTIATDKSADPFDSKVESKTKDGGMFEMDMDVEIDDEDDMMDMDDMDTGMDGMDTGMDGVDMGSMGDMMNMSGMGLGGDEKTMVQQMTPEMTCDITSLFSYKEGMFNKVAGTMQTKVNSMGMNMTADSKIEMILMK